MAVGNICNNWHEWASRFGCRALSLYWSFLSVNLLLNTGLMYKTKEFLFYSKFLILYTDKYFKLLLWDILWNVSEILSFNLSLSRFNILEINSYLDCFEVASSCCYNVSCYFCILHIYIETHVHFLLNPISMSQIAILCCLVLFLKCCLILLYVLEGGLSFIQCEISLSSYCFACFSKGTVVEALVLAAYLLM